MATRFRELLLPWRRQPQQGPLRPSIAYADTYVAFVGSTDAMIGSAAGSRWVNDGGVVNSVTPDGIAWAATSYSGAVQYWDSQAPLAGPVDWGGLTVVAVVPRAYYSIGSTRYWPLLVMADGSSINGTVNLTLYQSSTAHSVTLSAGNSSKVLSLSGYGNPVEGLHEWLSNDTLIIVGRWDKSTLRLAVSRNGVISRNANAHSYSFASGNQTPTVGGYKFSGGNKRNSACWYSLAALIPRDIGEQAENDLLANPWDLFEPQRVWVPVTAGAPAFKPAWARGSNVVIQGALA